MLWSYKRDPFDPDKDIPDLSGKVILITGGNDGLGKEASIALAKHNPAHLYLAARNAQRATATMEEIKTSAPKVPVTFLELDLASFKSIRKAVKQFLSESDRLDILMNNAGVMALEPGLTEDGYEIQFGINVVGHALLTKLLLPTLLKTSELPNADVRVINLTSQGAMLAPKGGILFDELRTKIEVCTNNPPWGRYGQSKLGNIFYATQLARHHPKLTSVSIHPGVTDTGLMYKAKYNNFIVKTIMVGIIRWMERPVSEGVKNQLWAVAEKKEKIVNGAYYEPVGIGGKERDYMHERDRELGGKLWHWLEKELEGQTLDGSS